MNENKWYQKSVFIVLFLVVFFPVGLYLLWKYTAWSKIVKWLVSVPFGIFWIFTTIALFSGNPTPTQTQPATTTQTDKQQQVYTTTDGTLARKIEEKVIEVLGAETNLKKPRVIGIDVEKYKAVDLQEYGYKADQEVFGVTVKLNSSENVTVNLQKQTLYKEAFNVLKNTFPLSPQIGDVIVWAYLPVKDKYGNTKDDIAITFSMARSLSEKINWGELNYSKLPDLLKLEGKNDIRNAYTELIKF